MVCPYCSAPTDVVNSRSQKRNNQVWRRRRCQNCGAVFTTHESIDATKGFIVQNADGPVPFTPEKLFAEVLSCVRDRQNAYEAARELTATITQKVFKNASKGLILPQNISWEAGQVLKRFDKQVYLRFAAEHPSLQK